MGAELELYLLIEAMVRKLRGGNKKETKHDKKERRAVNAQASQQLLTVVIPVLVGVALLIAGYIFLATRKAAAAA